MIIHRQKHRHKPGDRMPFISQSYLRWMASLTDSLLCKVRYMSFIGRTVSQLEAPFSVSRSTALLVLCGRSFLTSSNLSHKRCWFSLPASCCRDLTVRSLGNSCACNTNCSASGAVALVDAVYSGDASSAGSWS